MSITLRQFRSADGAAVVQLWGDTGLIKAWNDPWKDISRKLQVQPELFLVAVDGDSVVGSVMAGWDGHRGWLSYLAVSPARQGDGIGQQLVDAAERALTDAGCPKVLLMVRSDNTDVLGFYDQLGYGTENIVVRSKRLIPDAPPP